jgi:predicted phosphate transport protein (TIGR00153 family)
MAILNLFVPKDRKFFPLFEASTLNLVEISNVFYEMLKCNDVQKRKEMTRTIEDLEHVGDKLSHSIFNELNLSFITPFDREDIHALTSAIDNVVDNIHGAAKRIDIYKVEEIDESMVKLGELIRMGSEELHKAVTLLKNNKKTAEISACCVKINTIENHADDVFDMTIGRLFEVEKDAIKLIKIKEILSTMETATDMCEDAANVIQSIIIKHA